MIDLRNLMIEGVQKRIAGKIYHRLGRLVRKYKPPGIGLKRLRQYLWNLPTLAITS